MNERETRQTYQNTERDDATTGRSSLRFDEKPGLANEDEPQWRPPESVPESRPTEATLREDQSTPFEQ